MDSTNANVLEKQEYLQWTMERQRFSRDFMRALGLKSSKRERSGEKAVCNVDSVYTKLYIDIVYCSKEGVRQNHIWLEQNFIKKFKSMQQRTENTFAIARLSSGFE